MAFAVVNYLVEMGENADNQNFSIFPMSLKGNYFLKVVKGLDSIVKA